MSQHNHLLHFHLSNKKRINMFDKLILVAAFAYPLSAIPQVLEAVRGNIEGVSLLSWATFTVFATLFLVYSLIHRITPMIITYAMWWLVDAAMVVAILLA